MDKKNLEKALVGCLLGTAIGDALGLPWEGLSSRRQKKMNPRLDDGPRFFLKRGMISDDTEHTCMVAQALLAGKGEPDRFLRSFAWRLRFWLLGLPAGVGFATLRSILKLWMGYSPKKSGVFSAGNGPAMRSAILGAAYFDQPAKWQKLVPLCTKITHRDPKALVGSMAIALATSFAVRGHVSSHEYCQTMEEYLVDQEIDFQISLEKAAESAEKGQSPSEFAREMGWGKGVSGYIYHTVPVVLQAWFRYGDDFPRALIEVIRCGGDTDTTGAILGGIMGAGVGKEGIPQEWLDKIWEWPRSVRWMEALGRRLAHFIAEEKPSKPLSLPIWGLPLRNLFFTTLVLGHGFRRLLPPY